MKIEQVLRPDHERRVAAWYQAALNDPKVQPFLALGIYRALPTPSEGDWNEARFMDDCNRGMLYVTIDRDRRSAGIGLWVLDGNAAVAAALMLHVVRRIPSRYDVRDLAFAIAENNTAWRDRMLRIAGDWMWGREPRAAYDSARGQWVSALNFKVPVSELSKLRARAQ